MASARAGHGLLGFGQQHAISVVFILAKLLLILALAWRGAGPVAGRAAGQATDISRPLSS
jgi:hypothetical protein